MAVYTHWPKKEIYPSKRVKNHAARKLRNIYKLKGKVILKHAPEILYPERCYGLCFSTGYPNKATHRIILAEDINNDLTAYMSTLLHEYVHAWQFENGYPLKHNEKSGFKTWARYLKLRYNVEI